MKAPKGNGPYANKCFGIAGRRIKARNMIRKEQERSDMRMKRRSGLQEPDERRGVGCDNTRWVGGDVKVHACSLLFPARGTRVVM